jgi:hypothetical protein
MSVPVEFSPEYRRGHSDGVAIAATAGGWWAPRYQVAVGVAWHDHYQGVTTLLACRSYLVGLWHGVLDGRAAF